MKITAIKQQAKRQDRYSVFVDGKYAFSLSEVALLEQGLTSGQEIDAQRLKELKAASGADRAYGNALRYAAIRPRSEWEMQTYLQRKGVDEPIIDDIMQRLRRVGLLDDAAFAQAWVSSRRLLKNVSQRRLRLELLQKQVPEEIISQVLAENVISDQVALRQLIDKKRARYPDQTKLMQYLVRQGFSYDDIKAALNSDDSHSG